MHKRAKIQAIAKALSASFTQLKAETIITEILEKKALSFSDIIIFVSGAFARSYRRDVTAVHAKSNNELDTKLQFVLSRNGIYDALPEAIFHGHGTQAKDTSYMDLHKRHKKEEKHARTFFGPIENEIFRQKVMIEQTERQLVNRFSKYENSFLLNFWGIDQEELGEYTIPLLQLLPYAHKLSGDFVYIALGLQKIIKEKVVVKTGTVVYNKEHLKTRAKTHLNEEQQAQLLGSEFTLDLQMDQVAYPSCEFIIGPLKRSQSDQFLKGSSFHKLFDVYCDFFVPVVYEVKLKITYLSEEAVFRIHPTNSSRLGLTTKI